MKNNSESKENWQSVFISIWLLIFSIGFFSVILFLDLETSSSVVYILRLIFSAGMIFLITYSALTGIRCLSFIGRHED